jgi:hypothetical protein
MLLWVSLTLQHMSTIRSPFSAYYVYFLFNTHCFRRFFTWIALGDVDICFCLILLRKAIAVEEETKWAACWYHERNQSIHVTDGVTMTSLSGSLLQKISAAMDHLCQIVLNWKWSCKFEKWCKFSSRIKTKSHKKKSCETRPACTQSPFLQGHAMYLCVGHLR